ncbi:MAG TPA: PIG-L deacetylase family protein [Chloroflexota bacterium]|jgi:LmbE family N-acetylglucosaminyl deacetylase
MVQEETMQQRVLILAPHTDDAELGCGGTIARFSAEGREVFQVAFSSAEESVSYEFASDVLRHEICAAARVLGIRRSNLILLSYPVRSFPQCRQAILEDMVRLAREIKPDMVLLPSTHDTHQDHQTIAAEGFRAFKKTTMLGYEVLWNNLTFTTQGFVSLDQRDLDLKIEAIGCYKSQAHRPYVSPEFIQSLAITRGMQIGARYAEAFAISRWIVDDHCPAAEAE